MKPDIGRLTPSGIIGLMIALVLVVAVACSVNHTAKSTESPATLPAVTTSSAPTSTPTLPPVTAPTTPTPKSIFNSDHRINVCALLPIGTINRVAQDLPLHTQATDYSPEKNPAQTDTYVDACDYSKGIGTTGGGGARLIVHGYGSRDMSGDFNELMTALNNAQGHGMSKSSFYADNANDKFKLQDSMVFTDPVNTSKAIGFDLVFVYSKGATSYLVELNSDSWTKTQNIQALVTQITNGLPDLGTMAGDPQI
jgi:hypothetical protein